MKTKLFVPGAILCSSLLLFSCQEKMESTTDCYDESCQIGFYHNEMLRNFNEIRMIPSALTSETESDYVKKLLADYGASVRTTYARNPPTNDIDKWVGDIVNQSFTARQTKMINNITQKNMTCVAAINDAYGRDPAVASAYLTEIETLMANYGGSPSFDNKLNLLHLQYYKQASNEERTLISWITDVAKGSHSYWKAEAKNWNPRLSGRFWDKTLEYGSRILKDDIAGAVEYFIGFKLGLIGGPLSWKVGAAFAACCSIVSGVEILLEELMPLSRGEEYRVDVDYDEVYEMYSFRIKELNII